MANWQRGLRRSLRLTSDWYIHLTSPHHDLATARALMAAASILGVTGGRIENCRCGGWLIIAGRREAPFVGRDFLVGAINGCVIMAFFWLVVWLVLA